MKTERISNLSLTTITRFTKEQLLQRLEEQMSSARYALGFVQDSEILRDIEMDLSLAEIARECLGARPVYFVEIEGDQDINAGRVEGKTRFDLGLLPDGINFLYANPPVVNSDPIYQVQYGNDWRDVERGQYDDHAAHGSPVRIVYAAPPAPTVTFYRDGIEAAAMWVSQQRDAYDSEHGRHDPDTGSFEFGNDAQRDYSATLEEIAEGIRALHPNTAPPAPVLPDEKTDRDYVTDCHGVPSLEDCAHQRGWNACRAAMLQGKAEPGTTACKLRDAVETIRNSGIAIDADKIFAERDALNSPAIPDGYVVMPNRLTAENGAKGVMIGEFSETKFINCPECFGDGDCETCDGSGRIKISVPVSWTNIKAIWAKGVELFAAVPKQEVDPTPKK